MVQRSGMAAAAATLLAAEPRLCEVLIHEEATTPHDADDHVGPRIARVILLDRRRRVDEDLRQVWTPSPIR